MENPGNGENFKEYFVNEVIKQSNKDKYQNVWVVIYRDDYAQEWDSDTDGVYMSREALKKGFRETLLDYIEMSMHNEYKDKIILKDSQVLDIDEAVEEFMNGDLLETKGRSYILSIDTLYK